MRHRHGGDGVGGSERRREGQNDAEVIAPGRDDQPSALTNAPWANVGERQGGTVRRRGGEDIATQGARASERTSAVNRARCAPATTGTPVHLWAVPRIPLHVQARTGLASRGDHCPSNDLALPERVTPAHPPTQSRYEEVLSRSGGLTSREDHCPSL